MSGTGGGLLVTVLHPGALTEECLTNYKESNINANSYDLRASRVFEVLGGIEIYANGDRELPKYRVLESYQDAKGREMFRLDPKKLYQIETYESVQLPTDVCAITLMRSSMHKSGASGEVGLYDTGYKGPCGMTVSVGSSTVFERGASLFQMVFLRADTTELYQGRYLDSKWVERLITEKE